MLVEFQGAKAFLELPKIGDGWELVPRVKPCEASDINSHLHNIKARLQLMCIIIDVIFTSDNKKGS